jgi:competence protein ComEC
MARWAMISFVAAIAIFSFDYSSLIIIKILSVAVGFSVAASFIIRSLVPVVVLLIAFTAGALRAEGEPISIPYIDKVTSKLELAKDAFANKLSLALPEPHASYMGGLLVGTRAQIPHEVKDDFRKTGTSHLVALSGFNVTIIVNYLGRIFSSLWFPIGGIVIFVLATGAQSSLVRAAIMGSLALVATRYGHQYGAANSLLAAVVIMLFFDPSLLINDIGFQLSVAATAGLIYFVPSVASYLKWIPERWGLRENAAITLSAQATTFPIIFYYFGTISYVSPLVNVLVVIAVPMTMLFGFITGLAGFIHPVIAQLAGWPTWLLLTYQLEMIHFFASVT